MAHQSFWSLPAGWKTAFPWGLFLGVFVVGGMVVFEVIRGGGKSLDQLFWVEAAVLFPFVVVGGTAILAGSQARRSRSKEADNPTPPVRVE